MKKSWGLGKEGWEAGRGGGKYAGKERQEAENKGWVAER